MSELRTTPSRDCTLPAIAHVRRRVGGGHFVVIHRWTSTHVVLADPAHRTAEGLAEGVLSAVDGVPPDHPASRRRHGRRRSRKWLLRQVSTTRNGTASSFGRQPRPWSRCTLRQRASATSTNVVPNSDRLVRRGGSTRNGVEDPGQLCGALRSTAHGVRRRQAGPTPDVTVFGGADGSAAEQMIERDRTRSARSVSNGDNAHFRNSRRFAGILGAPGRIRTSDPRIRSPPLCPLSYGRVPRG